MEPLKIEVQLDKSAADRAAREFHAAEARRARETAKAQADEAKRAAKEQQAFLKDIERVAREASREQAKAARQSAKDQADAARDAEKIIRASLRQQAAEARKAAQEQARLDNRVLTEAEINERLKREIYRKTNQQRIQDLLKAHKTEIDKARESEQVNAQVMSSARGAITSFAGQMVGLSSATAVLDEVRGGFQRMRDTIFNSTELTQNLREQLLELAALKDRMGNTSAEAIDVLRFQAQTNQTRGDAIALQSSMLGGGDLAIQEGKISAEDARKAMVGIGRLQATEGGSAQAYGRLGATIMTTAKGPLTPEDVTREASALFEIAQPASFDFSSGINQFAKQSSYIKSGLMSAREAMAMTSAFGVANPDEAGTMVDQFVRATVGSIARNRKIAGLQGIEGSDNIGTAQYLGGLGAKEGMGPVDIARLVAADLKARQASADAKGEAFDPYVYLPSKGYGNMQDLKGLVDFTSTINSGTWDKTFQKMLNDPNLGAGRMAEVENRLANDPGLRGRQARIAEEMAKMVPGFGRDKDMSDLRRMGWSMASLKDKSLHSFEEIERAGAFDSSLAWWGDEKERVRQETGRMLMDLAGEHGVPFRSSYQRGTGLAGWAGSLVGTSATGSQGLSDQEMYRVFQQLGAQGVNVGQEVSQRLAEAAASMERTSQNMERAIQPPLNGAPRQPPAAPR